MIKVETKAKGKRYRQIVKDKKKDIRKRGIWQDIKTNSERETLGGRVCRSDVVGESESTGNNFLKLELTGAYQHA